MQKTSWVEFATLIVVGRVLGAALGATIALGLPSGARAQVIDPGTAVEACVSCHGPGTLTPVLNVNSAADAHFVDLNPAGPVTDSSYRQLNIDVTRVDVTGIQVVMEFSVTDENDVGITNLFDSDGRFALAQLSPGMQTGDPTFWNNITGSSSSERFTSTGGTFEALGDGNYRYSSALDPTTIPVMADETLRLAIQISASDLPAGNGWCDFDVDLVTPNDCVSPVSLTRDIAQTASCNSCHGVTTDTMLSFHGGGRTDVEYCVTCHNPGIGRTDFTNMVHKIHYGKNLTDPVGWEGFADVGYTRDIDNCLSCHGGSGVDEDNWETVPNRTACGSCHDDVDFDTGEGHGGGGPQSTNRFCQNCHPPTGTLTDSLLPVSVVHQGVARAEEAGFYRGMDNGFSIDDAGFDSQAQELTLDFSVTRDGQKQTLQSDPEWSNGARLALLIGWSSEEYTNEGSGSSPAPAQPISIDALDVGGVVMDLGGGNYRSVVDVSSFGFGNLTIGMEGHPKADILGMGSYSNIPVRDVFTDVNVEIREDVESRRAVVDIAKCNACHDASGAGLAFHGDNRTSEAQVCVLCHNPDATDIRQRPADPGTTPDGKREESVDFKRMIHGIHAGKDLEQGLVIYGFGGNPHDYSGVGFIGNNRNCLTCHFDGTYGIDKASLTLASTIDTGSDVTDPSDDLNISPITATCSSCHDDLIARNHMLLNGGSFGALDENIVVPEPGFWLTLLVGSGALGLLGRRRPATTYSDH
jgi:OmcA/MtrC family decaheme c-type cytochrome